MRLGVHTESLALSLNKADVAILYQPDNLGWDLADLKNHAANIVICASLDDIIAQLKEEARHGGHFVLMSNGSFGGIYKKLQEALS